jgi:ketosteroid isomerase-like protein
MPPENLEVVRAFIEATDRGDLDELIERLDPEVEWVPVESDPAYAVHRGHEDVRAWLQEWAEAFPDMRWEAERLLDAGEAVVLAVVHLAGRGAASGIDVETPAYAVVFTMRSGRIACIEEYADRAKAFQAVGLRE